MQTNYYVPLVAVISDITHELGNTGCRHFMCIFVRDYYLFIYIYVLSHVKTNNKSPTKYFLLDSASCRAAKELLVDTNRASLRQLLAAQ